MQVTVSSYTVEDMLKHYFDVEGMEIDLGPSPRGGYYYIRLETLLEQIADEGEDWATFEGALQEAAEDGIRDFLRERREFFKEKLAEKIEEHKAQNARLDAEGR